MNTPISIFIPTIGRFEYLREALDSVFRQRRLPCEIVLGFNGCVPPDWLTAIEDKARSLGIDFNHFTNPDRLPITESWRKGIMLAGNDYVTVLGDDDVFQEDFLEAAQAAIDRDNIDVYACAYTRIDGSGRIIGNDSLQGFWLRLRCVNQAVTRETPWFLTPPGIMALVFRRELFLASMPREAGLAFDIWTLRDMAWRGYRLTLDDTSRVLYRRHSEALSSRMWVQLLCDAVAGMVEFEQNNGSVSPKIMEDLGERMWRGILYAPSAQERRRLLRLLHVSPRLTYYTVLALLKQPYVQLKKCVAPAV